MNKTTALMLAATGGFATSGSAAVVYNESIGGDLSNNSAVPTVLTSGTDTIIGALDSVSDRSDNFIITNLLPGGTAQFDFSVTMENSNDGVFFIFSDPSGGALYTSPNYFFPLNQVGTTGDITVPLSGQVKITVQNINSFEG